MPRRCVVRRPLVWDSLLMSESFYRDTLSDGRFKVFLISCKSQEGLGAAENVSKVRRSEKALGLEVAADLRVPQTGAKDCQSLRGVRSMSEYLLAWKAQILPGYSWLLLQVTLRLLRQITLGYFCRLLLDTFAAHSWLLLQVSLGYSCRLLLQITLCYSCTLLLVTLGCSCRILLVTLGCSCRLLLVTFAYSWLL
jgi:hypothetical protein